MSNLKLGLKKSAHKKYVKDFVDVDYVEKLTEEEKEWLNQFLDEYYDTSFYKYKEKGYLHNTEELKKSCGTLDNARRRDIYAIKSCSGLLDYPDAKVEGSQDPTTEQN